MGTTNGRIYFIALRSLEQLEIQFVPEQLTVNRKPNVQQVEIVGLNLPRLQHQGGSRSITLELDFNAEEESRQDVIRKCFWLESLTYRDGPDKPAERVRLIWGPLFKRNIWMVESVKYDLKMFHKGADFLPTQAYVQVTLVQDGENEPRARDIKTL